MTPPLWPLAVSTWGEEERRAAVAVIESGRTTMGEQVRAFEAGFAAITGSKFAVMVNSGSSANLLAVAALFFTSPPLARPGAVAVVPAVSWATTYYPLAQYGLKLRFVDIDAETLNFDLAALARAIDDDVAVVFAANLLGNPNDFDAIERLLAGRQVTLLEDNCESLGATFGGRSAGSFGRIGTFSTFFSHHISTMEGGVCVTDDEELHQILLSLRSHGWTRHLPWPNRLVDKDPRGDFHELYRFILPGYNVRPLEIAAAIGVEQLRKLPDFIARRRENAERFLDRMAGIPGLRPQRELGASSWFGFALTLTDAATVSRDEAVRRLARAGVECRPVAAGAFLESPVMAHLPHEPGSATPNAAARDERGFFVGNHHFDARAQIDLLCGALRTALA
jgi:CDP-4-dehydro-6-deoxyglucose reductase, E1